MRVEDVTACERGAPFELEHGIVLLGVKVQLHATSARSVPANTFYATLLDARGDEYASTLAGCQPALRAESLQAGASAAGYISFEVPKTQRRFELRYAPQVIGPGIEELRFSVER